MRARFSVDHARNLVFRSTGVQLADAEIRCVQQAPLILAGALDAEDAANVSRCQGIKDLAVMGPTRNSIDHNWNFAPVVACIIVPGHAATGHETCAESLRLPGIALADLFRPINHL